MCPANITTNTELEATIPILSLVRTISVIKLLLFFWLWIKIFKLWMLKMSEVFSYYSIYLTTNDLFFSLNKISKNLWFIHLWYYLCLFFQNLQGCLKSNVYVFEFFYSFALKPHSIVFRLWYIVVSQHRIHIKWVPTVL